MFYCSKLCYYSAKPRHIENGTLCWKCDNYFCSWIAREEPVKGWVAKSRPYPTLQKGTLTTYTVIKCPEFIEKK